MNPVGNHIRKLCVLLQQHGAMRPQEVYLHFPNLTHGSVRACLHRSVEYRVVKRQNRGAYVAAPHWEDRLRDRLPQAVVTATPGTIKRHPLDSWLGATQEKGPPT